jgi:hypothetical protein
MYRVTRKGSCGVASVPRVSVKFFCQPTSGRRMEVDDGEADEH